MNEKIRAAIEEVKAKIAAEEAALANERREAMVAKATKAYEDAIEEERNLIHEEVAAKYAYTLEALNKLMEPEEPEMPREPIEEEVADEEEPEEPEQESPVMVEPAEEEEARKPEMVIV